MSDVTDALKKLRTATTLCLINGVSATTISLAYWCSDWKRWVHYSNGEFVKTEVTKFFPLANLEWNNAPSTMTEGVTCIVQLSSGRYILAYKARNVWFTRHTRREVHSQLLRAISVECLKLGSFKDV